jgi:hypothetical protein
MCSPVNANPFTGTWAFNAERSRLNFPPPLRWIQFVESDGITLDIREQITAPNGSATDVLIRAKVDGRITLLSVPV